MATGWRGQYSRYKDFFLNISSLYKQRPDLRAFLEVILSISTVAVFLLFALKPTALTIISLLNDIKEKQVTVAALTQKINDLKTARSVFDKSQNYVPNIEKSVGNAPEPDAIVQQVAGLSAKNSVDVLGISVGQITLVGTVPAKKSSSGTKPLPLDAKEMPISINIKGSYTSILSFVKDIENLRIAVKMDNIAVNSSKTDTGQVIVAVITGRVPYLGNAKE